eukprot:4343593-Prymnesium_polylepis.1
MIPIASIAKWRDQCARKEWGGVVCLTRSPLRGVRAVLYRQCVLGEHYSYVARIPGSPLWAARA